MKQKDSKYRWDFSHLFNNSKEWKEEFNKLDEIVVPLNNLKGKLNKLGNFSKHLELEKKLVFKLRKLGQYLHYGDLDLTNLEFQNLSNIYANKCKDISTSTSWISPELKKIGSKTILDWTRKNKDLRIYCHMMESFFRLNKYLLDEEKERLLSQVSISREVAGEIYDSLVYADCSPIYIVYKGKKQKLNSSLYHEIMENSHPLKDQRFRYKINKKWNAHFENHKHSLAKIYTSILQKDTEDTNIRGYNSSLEAELIGDNIPSKIYIGLIEVGEKNSNLYRKFLQIKKRYFGLKKFYGTDCSLKMGEKPYDKISIKKALEIIKKSLKNLGKDYEKKLTLALLPGQIDYYESTNKRKGAYSSGGLGVPPIILMNWDESLSSVSTLIHELGHSVHTLFAEENRVYPNTSYPIILAEVASTLNEHLLFDYLYKSSKDEKEKIYLLQNRIEDIMGTFFTQVEFAKFEWKAHQKIEKGEPLNADSLADLFKNVSENFGSDFLDKREPKKRRFNWPKISHFFHSPYYVYKYAIAIVASFKLYQEVKKNKTDNLFNFLKAGGHKDPLEILKDFGIDFEKSKTFEPLLNNLQKMIEELEVISKIS